MTVLRHSSRRDKLDVSMLKLASTNAGRGRFGRLFDLLASGKLEVRVLPDAAFGLVHGKVGVIRYGDSGATSFLGSVNESLTLNAISRSTNIYAPCTSASLP